MEGGEEKFDKEDEEQSVGVNKDEVMTLDLR